MQCGSCPGFLRAVDLLEMERLGNGLLHVIYLPWKPNLDGALESYKNCCGIFNDHIFLVQKTVLSVSNWLLSLLNRELVLIRREDCNVLIYVILPKCLGFLLGPSFKGLMILTEI